MKPLRQIAEEIGVSKQAVQKRISREPLCSRIQTNIYKNDNKVYIDELGEMQIKAVFSKSKSTTKPTTIHIDVHNEVVKILREQLVAKDKQISDLTNVQKILAENTKRNPKKSDVRMNKRRMTLTSKSGPLNRHYRNVKR